MDNGCGEWVRSWLEKARHDLETARRVIEREPMITDTAVYHCQQAAEKALKAVMIRHGRPVIKTHDLIALMTPYATHYRYPCNEADPDLVETIEAIELAAALVVFVQDKLGADCIDGADL